ncbi:serine/threonine-protein kinase [Streptomyces sp. INR7]|uniref:serine/threonine-protein kinase n=1 Tax=Streptomyces sp. INR7 TaxID=2607753 RepID=UPI0016272237|nr:serine/threonine-protein kinase [Streptomyces sp. INR7]QNE23631.1 serine/threonine protein kinase [Streptomyces sp. INR7]
MEPLRDGDPRRVGSFTLSGVLGRGGMGEVFFGHDESGARVAVKLISESVVSQPGYRQRFKREVEAARAVSGTWTPAIVGADTRADTKRPWVASVFVEGTDLKTLVENGGPLDAERLRELGAALAGALRDIHGAAIVHRDLKPANVLMTVAGPQVIDFGIAKPLVPDLTQLTEDGVAIGTVPYMSPEQASAQEVGPESDVFSLGSLLVFAATGRPPFGRGPFVQRKVVEEEPDVEGVPLTLEPLISACLEKDPAERPDLDQIIRICTGSAGWGTWAVSQKGPTPLGGSLGCLTGLLCVATAGAATAAGAQSPAPGVAIFAGLFLAWIVPWRVMLFINARRKVTVAVMVSWRGVALRFEEERVFHPWEHLDRVQLVKPAVGDSPLAATHSLVVTMSPHSAGLPCPDRLRLGQKLGVNLALSPAKTVELKTLLTHHHLRRPPEWVGRMG